MLQMLGKVKQFTKCERRSFIHRAVMRIATGFPLYVPKMSVLGFFEGGDVKILCSNPKKAHP